MSNVLCKTNQEIPQDMLLGNLLFTNLIDMKIPVADLTGIFKSNNIPESYVRTISQTDAFRRASSSIKNRVLYIKGANGYDKVRVEVDEIRNDSGYVKRIIGVKKIVGTNVDDISYQPMGEILFNRSTGICAATPLLVPSDADYKQFKDLCTEVEDKYADWSVYHNKDTVRNIINRVIADTHPVNLMPTGLCKFIPSTSTDIIYNLKKALEEMSAYSINANGTGGRNIMEIIPVIDTEEQRNLIQENFTAEVTNELFEFTQELKNVLTQKQTLSVRSATAYIEKFNLLRDKAKEYESLLGIYVNSIHQQITAALDLVNDNTDV